MFYKIENSIEKKIKNKMLFRTYAIHERDPYVMNIVKVCETHNEMCNFMIYLGNLDDNEIDGTELLIEAIVKNNWVPLFEDFVTYDKIIRSNAIEDKYKDALWRVM